jgi:ribosomal protein S12 methylthiotransferase
MRLQQKISEEKLKEKTGQVLTVLVEGFLPEDGIYAGRSFMDAPDVDGYVFFRSPRELMSGSFVKVKITEASEYDLKGVLV